MRQAAYGQFSRTNDPKTTKRIKPKDAPALFAKLGIKPIRGVFYKQNGQLQGCLNAALFEELHPGHSRPRPESYFPSECASELRDHGFSDSYMAGLMEGWDDAPLQKKPACMFQYVYDQYTYGRKDGKRAWELVSQTQEAK